MNSDKFHHVESNIKTFLKKKKSSNSDIKTCIQILDTQKNSNNYTKYKRKWEQLFTGYDFIAFRIIENRGGIINSHFLSNGKSPRKIKNRWPCYALGRDIAIDATGRVFGCCEAYTFRDTKTRLFLGSLREKSITEIILSKNLKKIKKMHLRDDYSELDECFNCTKPLNYPNIWKKFNGAWIEK